MLTLLFLMQTGALDPQGVYIDAGGVLRTRKVDAGDKLRELRKKAKELKPDENLKFISLPRLFAAAKEKGALTDEMKYLGGMVKLEYVFVYPDEKDLVIAGRCEPVDASFPQRPVGKLTGRPVLQLDDLVVALRTCGPGKDGTVFGCLIAQTTEAQVAMVETLKSMTDVVKNKPDKRREVADAMAAAAGLQPVEFFKIEPKTRFAYVCVEADYLLKRQALGLDPSPVKGLRSHLAMKTSPDTIAHRFWFETMYEPVRVAADGGAYEIRGQSLQIKTRKSFMQEDAEPEPIAKAYADSVTKHFTALSEHLLAYADLANLADLSVLAALIAEDKLAEKVGWDLEWVLKEYKVAEVDVPKNAETLVNYNVTSKTVIYAGGGVVLNPFDALDKKESGEMAVRCERPSDGFAKGVKRP